MSHVFVTSRPSPVHAQTNRLLGWLSSFALASMAGLAVTMNVVIESFHSARLGAVLIFLLFLHLLRYPRLLLGREIALYTCFTAYMVVSLLWTDDLRLAANTLVPAITFLVILILFRALTVYHNVHAVLMGTLFGIVVGAVAYTRIAGFPFTFPAGFSYNAIAGIYLSGLVIALLCVCYKGSKMLFLFVGSVFFVLVVATTSIKFNLGMLLGTVAAALVYFRHFTRALRRNAVPLVVLVVVLGYAVASNGSLMEILQAGVDRVMLGVDVLQARENMPGYSAFESRERWQADGIKGWSRNPLFGYGVEAFRDRYGITSHSTPFDVLYNFGLIGFTLFYGIFLSVVWRLFRVHDGRSDGLYALIFGALTCYLFISLSAPMHYNSFLAVFIAISTALLRRHNWQEPRAGVFLTDARA